MNPVLAKQLQPGSEVRSQAGIPSPRRAASRGLSRTVGFATTAPRTISGTARWPLTQCWRREDGEEKNGIRIGDDLVHEFPAALRNTAAITGGSYRQCDWARPAAHRDARTSPAGRISVRISWISLPVAA